jgi:hypothetical protein
MAIKKTSKLTVKPRKKSSALSTIRSKKAAAKASKATAKSKAAKKKLEELEDRKKLMELTLKGFQMAYEANQRGKFHRIL